MSALFSPRTKYITWRTLWIALAKAEKTLGLPITDEQIGEMEGKRDLLNLDRAHEIEKETRHDVMAHILAFGELCPKAAPILHLGATSAYVTDNGDLITMKSALHLIKAKCVKLLGQLAQAAETYADLPAVGYTHLQPAQPVTVGKRIALWLQDIAFDLQDLIHLEETLSFLGVKGATGTQASFVTLLGGDKNKVDELDRLLAIEMGFKNVLPISGQTYTRKQDTRILNPLAGLAASLHKMATDLRLLAHLGEITEPISKTQVGSSAMPHKNNPIRSERICSLARYLLSLQANTQQTHANQWLERTLDDSANRRITLPEAFLTADALLDLALHLTSDLKVHTETINHNLHEHLPSLVLEPLLMLASAKGKNRQEVHEILRKHARSGKDLLRALECDPALGLTPDEIQSVLDPNALTGRSGDQVRTYLANTIHPLLKEHAHLSAPASPVDV